VFQRLDTQLGMHSFPCLWSHCIRGLIFTPQFVQEHLLQSTQQKGHCNYYTYEYIHICTHNRLVMAEPLKVADDALKKITTQLECSVCLDTYTNPKLLPCFHTFCKKCLERLVVKDRDRHTLCCPNCRRTTLLPATGVSGLQTAFHIDHLFDAHKSLTT